MAFSFTADQYRRSTIKSPNAAVNNCLRATITFSFFSIILWVSNCYKFIECHVLCSLSLSLSHTHTHTQISIVALNILFLIWIFKGTDRDCKPSARGYSGFEGQNEDNKDDPEDLVPSGGRDNVYTPPEY